MRTTSVRVSLSTPHLRTPTLLRSMSLSNIRDKLRGSWKPCQATESLLRVRELDEESGKPAPILRSCQETYFEHCIPAVRKDKDADIFKKHYDNATGTSMVKPCDPQVVIVDHGASTAEHPKVTPASSGVVLVDHDASPFSDSEVRPPYPEVVVVFREALLENGDEESLSDIGGLKDDETAHGVVDSKDQEIVHDIVQLKDEEIAHDVLELKDEETANDVVRLEEEESVYSIREIDEDFEIFKARTPRRNTPSDGLQQAMQRHIEAAPPSRYPPRSSSLVSKGQPDAQHPKPEVQSRKDSSVDIDLVTTETSPPPIPEKSKLRPLPKLPKNESAGPRRGIVGQTVPRTSATPMPSNRNSVEKVTSTFVEPSKALSTVRSRLSSLKMPSINVFRESRTKRQSKTPEEIDFLNGKDIIYLSIHHARVKKADREKAQRERHQGETHRPDDNCRLFQWLRFNDDLAADARVTANGEDLRASSTSSSEKTRKSSLTHIEVEDTTDPAILIGPAGYGALTLGEMWIGGCDKKHKFDSHQSVVLSEHDEPCPCKLNQVFDLITDESYKYLGVARSAGEGKWVVHLAKEMPMGTAEATASELRKLDRPIRPTFTIARKPIPARASTACRVGFI